MMTESSGNETLSLTWPQNVGIRIAYRSRAQKKQEENIFCNSLLSLIADNKFTSQFSGNYFIKKQRTTMDLSNNKILITGGATGIGFALAERFVRENNTVIICGRRESALKEAVKRSVGNSTR